MGLPTFFSQYYAKSKDDNGLLINACYWADQVERRSTHLGFSNWGVAQLKAMVFKQVLN